jgi:hypothetical protein
LPNLVEHSPLDAERLPRRRLGVDGFDVSSSWRLNKRLDTGSSCIPVGGKQIRPRSYGQIAMFGSKHWESNT